jgi:hypothetical protein
MTSDLVMPTSSEMTSDLSLSTLQDTSSQQSVTTTTSNDIASTETDTTHPHTKGNCCHCHYVNVSGEQLVNIDEVISTLTIENKLTSSYRRSLTCAPDSRMSSLVMGWVGILSISIPFMLLLIVDLINCVRKKHE